MVAVAASPTPGAAAASSPFAAKAHKHPPYKDMVVRAIETLKDQKGSSRPAISKYIADNYSGLPSNHSALLTQQLRRLQSKGVIRMLKHSYKLAEPTISAPVGSNVGSRKVGRPPKSAHPVPPVVFTPRRRGRPSKLEANPSVSKKTESFHLPNSKTLPVVDSSSVYILPQAEQLKSGFWQNLLGAVAIILPHGLLSKKTASSPVLILPKGVQSLLDATTGKKKLGRPRKDLAQKNPDFSKETQPILQTGKAVIPKQVVLLNGDTNGDLLNVAARKRGRPRKNMNNVVPTEAMNLQNAKIQRTNEVVQDKQNASGLEFKKRSVGRPRKIIIVGGLNPPPSTAKASEGSNSSIP